MAMRTLPLVLVVISISGCLQEGPDALTLKLRAATRTVPGFGGVRYVTVDRGDLGPEEQLQIAVLGEVNLEPGRAKVAEIFAGETPPTVWVRPSQGTATESTMDDGTNLLSVEDANSLDYDELTHYVRSGTRFAHSIKPMQAQVLALGLDPEQVIIQVEAPFVPLSN